MGTGFLVRSLPCLDKSSNIFERLQRQWLLFAGRYGTMPYMSPEMAASAGHSFSTFELDNNICSYYCSYCYWKMRKTDDNDNMFQLYIEVNISYIFRYNFWTSSTLCKGAVYRGVHCLFGLNAGLTTDESMSCCFVGWPKFIVYHFMTDWILNPMSPMLQVQIFGPLVLRVSALNPQVFHVANLLDFWEEFPKNTMSIHVVWKSFRLWIQAVLDDLGRFAF